MERPRQLLPALLWAVTGCAAARPSPPPVRVTVTMVADECRLEAEGRSLTLATLPAAARAWRQRGAFLKAGTDTPYRCFGGALFALQKTGVKRIGWIAEPPAAEREAEAR
jgi:hypothetical protein